MKLEFKGKTSDTFHGQRYYISGTTEGWQENWKIIVNTLLDDLEFHELLLQYQTTAIVNPDLSVTFKAPWIHTVYKGQEYSKLIKALWDKYHTIFQDYGLELYDLRTESLQ
tara:strand:+ start:716 stop:1048 length:333 start_codon:yes stop_codon:yes gene_type:complete